MDVPVDADAEPTSGQPAAGGGGGGGGDSDDDDDDDLFFAPDTGSVSVLLESLH